MGLPESQGLRLLVTKPTTSSSVRRGRKPRHVVIVQMNEMAPPLCAAIITQRKGDKLTKNERGPDTMVASIMGGAPVLRTVYTASGLQTLEPASGDGKGSGTKRCALWPEGSGAPSVASARSRSPLRGASRAATTWV